MTTVKDIFLCKDKTHNLSTPAATLLPRRRQGNDERLGCSIENPCMSNFKNKPALYETQLLLVANEETERGMFERWERALLLVRRKRVTPFPSLAR